MAVIQTPWNKYEIALLIDTYVSISEGKISRKEGIALLSKRLRAKVISQGGSINEQYRNENGIQLQMAAMAYVLTDGEEGKTGASNSFVQSAQEYLTDRDSFSHTLFLAEQLYPIPATPKPYVIPDESEEKSNILSDSSIAYKSADIKNIRRVLEEKFKKSFRLNSSIEIRRFRKFYEDLFEASLSISDEELIDTIKECGIVNEDKVFLPENVLSLEDKQKVFSYIENLFSSGGTFVYYNALLERFKDMFLDSLITDRQSLRSYLQYFDEQGWSFNTFYVSDKPGVEPNLEQYVFNFLSIEGDAVEDERVYEAVPYNTIDQVRRVLNNNPEVVISTGREGKHFHISSFNITDQERQGIDKLIGKLLNASSYTTFDELSEHISLNYPNVLKDNEHFSDIGIRNALRAIFSGRYQFVNNIISKKGDALDSGDIFRRYSISHSRYSIDEMENLACEFKTLIPFDILLENSIRINHDEFVSKSIVSFDIIGIDKALNEFIEGPYRNISSFDNFTIFPECGFSWNQYLLESYVMTKSKQFQLWHNRLLKDNVTGAIVRRDTVLNGYDELLIDAVARSRVNLNENEVLDFLLENQYIAKRRKSILKELSIIEKASKIRNNN